jgi:hypothetical protein
MASSGSSWWKYIYDKWLEEGDLKILRYLQKIDRYLHTGRKKSQQETLNLTSQIEALVDLHYTGQYKYLNMGERSDTDIVRHLMTPSKLSVRLPDDNDLESVTLFFTNPDNIRIKPQNTVPKLTCHPCWILWARLYNRDIRDSLWLYRKQFIYYMDLEDYQGAAKVYMHALKIKERTQMLPLYSPYVLQRVMYCNIDIAARSSLQGTGDNLIIRNGLVPAIENRDVLEQSRDASFGL